MSQDVWLAHVPSDEERDRSLSTCHVCMEQGPLTREHVPPRSAFNTCTRLWDRLILEDEETSTRRATICGGLWVQTLCRRCNNEVCSPYAAEYVRLVKALVESPHLLGPSGEARAVRVKADTLLVAKEIAAMICAAEQIGFVESHPALREFVLDPGRGIDPGFRVLAFLVPDVPEAGTVSRFHARTAPFKKGRQFSGGEISWFPFGFLYATTIGCEYHPERLTDITHWFRETDPRRRREAVLQLHTRVTGVDSIQCVLGRRRVRPQIDHIGEEFS